MSKKLILLALILSGCNARNFNTPDEILSQMKSPVIIIGSNSGYDGTTYVSVKDSTGRVATFSGTALSIALMPRQIGDTIK